MKRNDLMSEYIVARSDRGRNRDRPGVVVGDEIVRFPEPRGRRTTNETSFLDLEEFQTHLVSFLTITSTLCHVVNDRSVMRLGPLVPLQINGGTRSDGGMDCTRRAILSTNDVAAAILAGRNESSVRGVICPSNDFGRIV